MVFAFNFAYPCDNLCPNAGRGKEFQEGMIVHIAIISDIHGNCLALEAALVDLEQHPVEQLVCLGDAIQGGPQPAETVQRLRKLACPVVMGNADAWLLSGQESGREAIAPERLKQLQAVWEWSLSKLSEEDVDFIAQFQPTVKVTLGGEHQLLCFHGSPGSYDDIILPHTPEDEVRGYLAAYRENILTGGHTHLQQIRRLGQTIFFNPGSIGLVYEHHQPQETFRTDAWAEYAVLTADGERTSLEFRRVPYDVDDLIGIYRRSGRPFAQEAIAQYSR